MTVAPSDLRRLAPDDAALYKDIRLEGLAESPDAFSSTLDAEENRPLEAFAERLADTHVVGAFSGAHLVGVTGFYVQGGPKHARIRACCGACMCGRNVAAWALAGCWSRRSSSTPAKGSNCCS